MRVDGQCHCGAITYEAEVDPATVSTCHCGDCQRLTGTAFRITVPAPAATFRILTGEPRKYIKTADSGTKRIHAFCGDCGAPIYASAITNPASYSLRVGGLNQARHLAKPARQIWVKRRFSWIAPIDGVPEFSGQP